MSATSTQSDQPPAPRSRREVTSSLVARPFLRLADLGLGRYGWMFIAMCLLFFGAPLLSDVRWIVRMVDLAGALVLIAGVRASWRVGRHHFVVLIALGAGVAIAQGIELGMDVKGSAVFTNAMSLLFVIWVIGLILRDIFTTTRVTVDTLMGTICVYLLLAAAFAAMFSIAIELDPDCFVVNEAIGVPVTSMRFHGEEFALLGYFSVTTLTTLGYGDIVPSSPTTRALANFEALTGQIYLTIIVARLVGMHIYASTTQ